MTQNTEKPDHPGLPMPPPFLLGGALVLAFVLEFAVPLRFLDDGVGWQFWLGMVLSVFAIGGAMWAVREFGRAGTHVNPAEPATTIVDSGPFRFVRNPMYSCFLILLAGVSLVIGLEWGLLLIPVLWLTLHFLIVMREERYLTAKFAEAYAAYRRRVRRWGLF